MAPWISEVYVERCLFIENFKRCSFEKTPIIDYTMDEQYIEKLARAYNEKLRGTACPEYSDARYLAEEQLGILERMNSPAPIIRYLKSLKRAVVDELRSPEGRNIPTDKLPSGRGGVERLLNLEIELFIALDTLAASGRDVSLPLALETRFTAFLGALSR